MVNKTTTDNYISADLVGSSSYYRFDCKATIPALMFRSNKGKKFCPDCGAALTSKIITCKACGKHVLRAKCGPESTLCKVCYYSTFLQDMRKSREIPDTVTTRRDCKYYVSDCLLNAGIHNKPYVNCTGCKRYKFQPETY